MTAICSICASTQGPFSQEQTGVAATPLFIKCQACASECSQISFDSTVGRGAPLGGMEKNFYTCQGCGHLFYKAVPYAFLNFDVRECPGCKHPFPSEEDIRFPQSTQGIKIALRNPKHSIPESELESIHNKLLEIQPSLAGAIDDILFVDTAQGKDIWVITKGNHPQMEEALRWILLKATDRKLAFSSSKRSDMALQEKDVSILKSIKA